MTEPKFTSAVDLFNESLGEHAAQARAAGLAALSHTQAHEVEKDARRDGIAIAKAAAAALNPAG